MKKNLIKLLFITVVLFSISFSAAAQIYVHVRPTFPVIVRPPQPSRVHIWVNEEWEPNGQSYRYSGGHWEAPSRPGYYRRPGHWKRSRQGQMWVPGNWAKRSYRGKRH